MYRGKIGDEGSPRIGGGLRVGDLANKNNVLSLWPFFGAVIYIN